MRQYCAEYLAGAKNWCCRCRESAPWWAPSSSVGLHLLVSIPLTQSAIRLQRSRLPGAGNAAPSPGHRAFASLLSVLEKADMLPAEPAVLAIWIVVTAAMAWWVVLTEEDRRELGATLLRAPLLANGADLARH